MSDDIVVIEMQRHPEECIVCGAECTKSGIPVHEDMVVHNAWDGPWGGAPACVRCRTIQEGLTAPMTIEDFQARAARFGA